ncbi:MAG: S-methyl-5'-thioadenosine phosphorylase [Bacillota bacterium]
MEHQAEIGVFGGSGFYSLGEGAEEVAVETPYGAPSDRITLVTIAGHRVAFLPRHGRDHRYPPHLINYRANAWAMKKLGVSRIIGPCAAGSLQPTIKPGDFVISDQLVDRTHSRQDTFITGPIVRHLTFADPYCPTMRQVAVEQARGLGITAHDGGTMVVIQGPRFSTRAESRWFSSMGWHAIGMTQYPEVPLARELGMCFLNIALITDFDAGLEGSPDVKPVSHEEVLRVFDSNVDRVKQLLFKVIENLPPEADRTCGCGREAVWS